MQKSQLIKIIKHALLTGIAMDIIGFAFCSRSEDERVNYLKNDKGNFPTHKEVTFLNQHGSFNTRFSIFLLDCFAEFCPVEVSELPEFEEYLKEKLPEFLSYPNPFVQGQEYTHDKLSNLVLNGNTEDNGLLIPIAITVGLYAAAIEADLLFLYSLFDSVLMAIDPAYPPRNSQILAYLAYRLIFTGYFGYHLLIEVEEHNLYNEDFEDFFLLLCEKNINFEFLNEKFNRKLVEKLSYTDQVIAELLFYMCRVDAAYRKDNFKSLPREQLVEVFTSGEKPVDLAYAFGCICTASEQLHPLVPKNLRENNQYRNKVSDALSYL